MVLRHQGTRYYNPKFGIVIALTRPSGNRNRNDMADPTEAPGTIVIGEGVLAKGVFKVPGRAIINGSLEGELVAKDLFVGPTGKGVGKFKAEMADVRGEVHDTLVTTSSLVVRASGKISGAVYYREVEIEKGGEIEGHMAQGGEVPAVGVSAEGRAAQSSAASAVKAPAQAGAAAKV